jgi:hypothetical protein
MKDLLDWNISRMKIVIVQEKAIAGHAVENKNNPIMKKTKKLINFNLNYFK